MPRPPVREDGFPDRDAAAEHHQENGKKGEKDLPMAGQKGAF